MDNKYILYLDNLQRLIMGELIEKMEEKQKILVKNPIILHVNTIPRPDGQSTINIQFFPLMFKEFIADKDQPTFWEVSTEKITPCRDIALDMRLISQYNAIFSPSKTNFNMGQPPQNNQPQAQTTPTVIKLFDD